MVKIVRADGRSSIRQAAEVLRGGGLAAFPTETVYGLGADATNGAAVARIFEAKQRPEFNPLIIHLRDRETAARIGRFSPDAANLADAFWPGPLTLVLTQQNGTPIAPLATAGLDTVAVRVPAHPVAQALLREADIPVAAPSANSSGSLSPTTARHVADDLGARIDIILDGGPCDLGLESTIVDCSADEPALLRPGGISTHEIESLLGRKVPKGRANAAVSAPGQLASHYAPKARLRLNATSVAPGEALLAFGEHLPEGANQAVKVLNLSPSGNLREAAANLFTQLHELDACKAHGISVMPIPTEGLGEAINDRLRRGAAPRGVPIQK